MIDPSWEVDVPSVLAMESVRIIDIRTDDEVASAPLAGAHEHIPMDRLLNQPETIKSNEVTILVCAAGIRSGMATEWFRKQGMDKGLFSNGWAAYLESKLLHELNNLSIDATPVPCYTFNECIKFLYLLFSCC